MRIASIAIGLSLAFAGLCAGFVLGRQWPSPEPAHRDPPSPVPTALAGPLAVQTEVAPVLRSTSAPVELSASMPPVPKPSALPPPLTPVHQWLSAVSAQAEAGDNAAAMRLYDELGKCSALRFNQRVQLKPRDIIHHSIPRRVELVTRMAEEEVQYCFRRTVCEGLTESDESQSLRWLALAAERGDALARFQFALGEFLRGGDLDSLELAPLYRARALDWMQAAMWAGSSDAALQLAEAYLAPDEPAQKPLAQLVPHDPVQGAALLYALFHLRLSSERTLSATVAIAQEDLQIAPDQLAQAEREGLALYTAYMKDQQDPNWPRYPETAAVPLDQILRRAPQCLDQRQQ